MSRRRAPPASLPDRVRRTIADRHLFDAGDAVVIAVSGGPDSLALLHVLFELRGEWSLRLVVAHLDHGMRPGVGEADAAFVAETAARLGLPCVIERADVPTLARERRLSLEEAGRDARYAFLGRVAAAHAGTRIATGHTADDRVETLLLNLARGTGIDGLAGIPARRPLWPGSSGPEVVRPLIDCWRREVEAYCAVLGLAPRHDATNDLAEPARNRVRRELIPWLERELSPAIRERLLRLATMAEEESAVLYVLARELLARGTLTSAAGLLHLDAACLAAAPPPLARRALREAVRELRSDLSGLDWETFDTLLRLARGELRTGVTLPGAGIAARRDDGVLVLRSVPAGAEPATPLSERALSVPGAVEIPERACRLGADIVPRPASLQVDPACEAYLDLDRLQPPLVIRSPRPGDRIRPLGMTGHRKLSDLFVDRKLPRAQRTRTLVIADAVRILWVVGCCISDDARVMGDTTRVLRLTADSMTPPMNADERR